MHAFPLVRTACVSLSNPSSASRFAFELYDDDGSEFISHEELSIMVDDVFGDDFDKDAHVRMLIKVSRGVQTRQRVRGKAHGKNKWPPGERTERNERRRTRYSSRDGPFRESVMHNHPLFVSRATPKRWIMQRHAPASSNARTVVFPHRRFNKAPPHRRFNKAPKRVFQHDIRAISADLC